MTTFDHTPEPVPQAINWWSECYPQWKGRNMTTPQGRPSVQPRPRDLGEQLQDPAIAQTQANAQGGGRYTGSGEPAPKIVGQYMDDVDGRYTEGATVSNDQTQMGLTARVDTDD